MRTVGSTVAMAVLLFAAAAPMAARQRATAAAAVDHFGRIDTWVGVAGAGLYGRAWETLPEEYDTVMRTNWLGQVHGALAALPKLRRTGGT